MLVLLTASILIGKLCPGKLITGEINRLIRQARCGK